MNGVRPVVVDSVVGARLVSKVEGAEKRTRFLILVPEGVAGCGSLCEVVDEAGFIGETAVLSRLGFRRAMLWSLAILLAPDADLWLSGLLSVGVGLTLGIADNLTWAGVCCVSHDV